MKRYAILVAGGSGNRMKTNVPKQFLLLAGKPILMHTIARFHEADASIEPGVVLPGNEIETWKDLCKKFSFSIAHEIIEGGETRFHSVKNGLQLVKEKSVVAIHDGVRPFTSPELIRRCFSEAEKYGSAVPEIPMNESIRRIENGKNEIADRSSFVIIQTPQCFDSEILKEAYKADYKNDFTDDASVVEFLGQPIHLTEGERENIKITFPFDLLIGEVMVKKNLRETKKSAR